MQNIRIKYTAISKLGTFKFIQRCRIIQKALERHPDLYPAPPVNPLTLLAAIEDLFQKSQTAADGSKQAKSARDIQKTIVWKMIQETGVYLIGLTVTQPTYEEKKWFIERTGFETCEGPHHRIGAIEPAYLLNATAAPVLGLRYVDLRWKRGGKGAYSFTIEGQLSEGFDIDVWQTLGTSFNTKFRASGLQPGIWVFRVIAQGAAGPAAPSQMAQAVVA